MNVATRITMATAVVVALASAGYAAYQLRERRAERLDQLGTEARAVGGTIRNQLENPNQGSAFVVPNEKFLRDIEIKSGGWRVKVAPRVRKDLPPGPDLDEREVKWLRALVDSPSFQLDTA